MGTLYKEMYYAIHLPVEARGVYDSWKDVAPKALNIRNSRYKKFRTEYDAKYWSKHGECRKSYFLVLSKTLLTLVTLGQMVHGSNKMSPYMSHISRVEWAGQWSERMCPLIPRGAQSTPSA